MALDLFGLSGGQGRFHAENQEVKWRTTRKPQQETEGEWAQVGHIKERNVSSGESEKHIDVESMLQLCSLGMFADCWCFITPDRRAVAFPPHSIVALSEQAMSPRDKGRFRDGYGRARSRVQTACVFGFIKR